MSIELKNIKVTDIVFEDRARQNYKDLDILQADIAETDVISSLQADGDTQLQSLAD